MGYRLGLDIGTNSLGWAVIALDEDQRTPSDIINAGVRIFADGRDPKTKSTLKAERGAARSARRRHDRYKQRRIWLINELAKNGLFPSDRAQQLEMQSRDPFELRSKALREQLHLHEIGRILFHLNQRRGFKSNRKDSESRDGVVNKSIEKLQKQLEETGCETLGQYLWARRKRQKSTRVRREGSRQTDLYNFYPSRAFLEKEFDLIFERQRPYYPDLLTEESASLFKRIIFTQRPLKPATKGRCSFYSNEDRTYRAMPGFQRFRLLQEVNNLEWSTAEGQFKLSDVPEARDLVLDVLERPNTKSGEIKFSKIKKIVKELGLAKGDFQFNLESDRREGLSGNLTSNIFQQENCIGEKWFEWELEKQENFVSIILDDSLDDDKAINELVCGYGISEEQANNCIAANLQSGVAHISLKAAHSLANVMKTRFARLHEALAYLAEHDSEFENPYRRAEEGQVLDQLPYYGLAVKGHIIPGKGTEEFEQNRIGMVSNPTVHIALNQIRQVVNEIIQRYGHPHSIAIEMARDLPSSSDGRRKIEKEYADNQKRNDRLREVLREHNQIENRENLNRLKLWEELSESPTDRRCPFSGKLIGIVELFDSSIEIEHLIPSRISLDDSLANKTICTRKSNRDKGNQTPFQAFGNSPGEYNWPEIFERSRQLPKSKQWRFNEDALEIWKRDHDDFLGRHLNDTRYIGRLAKEYLENICSFNRIEVLTGRLTALLRGYWGLNSILDESGSRKNRDDHRHHAVDAIVIGMVNRSILQKVSTAAARAEELEVTRIFENRRAIDPWPGFRQKARSVV